MKEKVKLEKKTCIGIEERGKKKMQGKDWGRFRKYLRGKYFLKKTRENIK